MHLLLSVLLPPHRQSRVAARRHQVLIEQSVLWYCKKQTQGFEQSVPLLFILKLSHRAVQKLLEIPTSLKNSTSSGTTYAHSRFCNTAWPRGLGERQGGVQLRLLWDRLCNKARNRAACLAWTDRNCTAVAIVTQETFGLYPFPWKTLSFQVLSKRYLDVDALSLNHSHLFFSRVNISKSQASSLQTFHSKQFLLASYRQHRWHQHHSQAWMGASVFD